MRLAAAAQREERESRFIAAMTANLINANGFVKHAVTVEQLLGLPAARGARGKLASQLTAAEREKAAQQMAEKLKRNAAKRKQSAVSGQREQKPNV